MEVEQEKMELQLPDIKWTKELKLVKEITAKNCDDTEFKLLAYTAKLYGLNPLKKEIWAVKYENRPALIFVGRDGLLSIAHRTGQFGSMETTCELEQQQAGNKIVRAVANPVSATCTIWRQDYDKPFKITVYFDEFKRNTPIWLEKPKTMLAKVAEAHCLRRAFNISGLLVPEEMPEVNKVKENGEV